MRIIRTMAMMNTPNTIQLLDILRFIFKSFKIHEKINPIAYSAKDRK